MAIFDLAAVFEHLPNALMVLDAELRYVAVNAAYLRATGAERDALIGRPIFDVFPDDPADPNSANVVLLRTSFQRVLRTGKVEAFAAIHYRVPRGPGLVAEERIWSAKHTPLFDGDGRVAFLIQETADVTHLSAPSALTHLETTVLERAHTVQATATLLDAQLRDLRQMFAQAPGFMCFLHGPTHVFEIVNAAYLQLVGHRDVVGMSVAEALPEVVGQGFVELLDRVYTSGEPFLGRDVPIQLQRTPGAAYEDCFVDFVYQPIRDGAGNVIGIFTQGQDVTEQHRAAYQRDVSDAAAIMANRARMTAEARQQFLVESIPVQVWTSTPAGQLDFVSQLVTTYFDRSAEQVLGDGWLGVLHPDDADAVTARWSHSLTTGEPYEVEFRLRRADGEYRWHLGRARAERDASGAIVRWLGTNTDIHDAKVALAELQARSQYEQRLLGIVSHDLRNPLNAILLAGSVVATTTADPQTARMAAVIQRAGGRATRLIQDLLDFAKQRIGATIPINPRPTNLREVVEQVVDELQVASPTRTIRVGHHGFEDGSWDADRIAQVISNLVGNALQHGTSTSPVVVESTIDGDHATLSVTNLGAPIADADLARIFEPFARTTSAGAGTGSLGLGLYIAREVVTAHGGRIDVDSHVDTGTRFTVRLPRYAARA